MEFSKFFDDVKKKKKKPAPDSVQSESSKDMSSRKRKNRGKTGKNVGDTPSIGVGVKAGKKRKRNRPPKTKNSGSDSGKRRKSSPPSEEALALSSSLKELSKKKSLKHALKLYWDPSNDGIRDGHHGCIMVDCCARSGDIEQGEKIIASMRKSRIHVNVETNTALLKGYSHSGMMEKASSLFREMCMAKARRDRPNVRTLNTLLRGCLWTAASLSCGSPRRPVGGVVTSEEALSLYRSSLAEDVETGQEMDLSSYEYSITMLCQALLCDASSNRIDEMKQMLGIGLPGHGGSVDRSATESLAVCLLSLSRSYSLLGNYAKASDAAEHSLKACNEAISFFADTVDEGNYIENRRRGIKKKETCGGKRAWRKRGENPTMSANDAQTTRRTNSNTLFRVHRLKEIASECHLILSMCRENRLELGADALVFFLLTRLLYFSGGGTTGLSATRSQRKDKELSPTPEETTTQLLTSLWHSFGLKAALDCSSFEHKTLSKQHVLSEDECGKLVKAAGLSGTAIDNEGYLDFNFVFTPQSQVNRTKEASAKRPICIELGSGFGDWITVQARLNPSTQYVSVELRSDRVAQTFSKAMLYNGSSPLSNLCCVGSEALSFLRDRVRRGSVSTVFVNHPEPPTQTHGSCTVDLLEVADGGDELAHMLNSEMLISAAHCLKEGAQSRLVIVTDNRWYARLICATLLKVMRENSGLLHSAKLGDNKSSGFRQVEVFPRGRNETDRVILYEGQPSAAIGHALDTGSKASIGVSYFDRLWRMGAGSHAEDKKRFVIVMERPSQHVRGSTNHTKSKDVGQKKKRKSEAKQRRRNERRLKKQLEASN